MEWDRSHDWVLIRCVRDRAEVAINFAANLPSIQEVVAVRRCLPQFRDKPPEELVKSIGHQGRLVVGEYDSKEAQRLRDLLLGEGLNVSLMEASSVGFLPFDRTNNVAMLIENDARIEELAQAMMRSGVPIQDIGEI